MPKSTQEMVPIGSHKDFAVVIPIYFQQEVVGIRTPATANAKRQDLKKFLFHFQAVNGRLLPTDQWLPRDTRSFLDALVTEGYAPASINRMLATLRAFSYWLVESQVIKLNPCKGIRDLQLAPLAPRAIRDREWYRLQKTADVLATTPAKRYSQGIRNRAILAALNASGLRIGELLGLKLQQLVGKKLVNVFCKGSKVRSILITQETAALLVEYVRDHRVNGSEYLFTNRYGGQLSRNGIAGAFHRIAAHASVNLPEDEQIELRPHLLRHRHAYKARSAHGDVYAAKRLGHASLKHLERYSMLTDAEEEELLERM